MNEKIKVIEGGVTAAKGFMAASTAAGIKYKNRQDMAMIYSKQPCKSAGTFTTNLVKAAPAISVTIFPWKTKHDHSSHSFSTFNG